MRLHSVGIVAALLASVAQAAPAAKSRALPAAEPVPGKGVAPAWVTDVPVPKPVAKRKDAPAQVLLIDGQTLFGKNGATTFVRTVVTPQTMAGLQAIGTVAWPWEANRTTITFNRLEIRRAGQVIDLLKDAKLRVLERETSMEQSRFDGLRTVVMPVPGLQLGDELTVALTYSERPGARIGAPETIANALSGRGTALTRTRYIVPAELGIRTHFAATAPKPVVSQGPLGTDYVFAEANAPEVKFPDFVRPKDKLSDIQFSSYRSWAEVAATQTALYRAARKVPAGSPVLAEADRIADTIKSPEERMMAALRLTQDQVRYVAVLLGNGAYKPTAAEETWASKYGDCKAKTALLLALLDRLQIKAEPMLARSSAGDILADRLPSLESFDHIIVRAQIGAKPYFLDATDYGQRVVDEVTGSSLFYGLPVVEGANLERLPRIALIKPSLESELTWDATRGLTGNLPFTARVTFRGAAAAAMRAKLAQAETSEAFETQLKDQMPGVNNKDLELVSKVDDAATGLYVATFTGSAEPGWEETDDPKGYRLAFDNNAARWNVKFDRDSGDFKDLPVQLNDTFWQQETETVLLGAAKGFKVEAKPMDSVVGGAHITRNVRLEADRAVAVTTFRHLKESISAKEARDAPTTLSNIADDTAELVAPRSYKPPRVSVK
jgi:transglutaminase-like putative cysteine protease